MQQKSEKALPEQASIQKILDEIQRAIENLRFGSIEITVHEGRVTQIERREKLRLNN